MKRKIPGIQFSSNHLIREWINEDNGYLNNDKVIELIEFIENIRNIPWKEIEERYRVGGFEVYSHADKYLGRIGLIDYSRKTIKLYES